MDYYFGFAKELLDKGLAKQVKTYGQDNFYDLVAHFDDDLDFYGELATGCGGRVLDIGCGSGRVLHDLAIRGVPVVGLDASAEMIEKAHARLGSYENVELIVGDMRDFSLPYTFDLIMIPYCSLIYMRDDRERLSVFERCYSHLNQGGKLAFDFVAGEVTLGEQVPQLAMQGIHPITGDLLVSTMQTKGLSKSLRILNQIDYIFNKDASPNWLIQVQHSIESVVKPEDTTKLLTSVGFVVEGVYRDQTLVPYDEGDSCFIIAQK